MTKTEIAASIGKTLGLHVAQMLEAYKLRGTMEQAAGRTARMLFSNPRSKSALLASYIAVRAYENAFWDCMVGLADRQHKNTQTGFSSALCEQRAMKRLKGMYDAAELAGVPLRRIVARRIQMTLAEAGGLDPMAATAVY